MASYSTTNSSPVPGVMLLELLGRVKAKWWGEGEEEEGGAGGVLVPQNLDYARSPQLWLEQGLLDQ